MARRDTAPCALIKKGCDMKRPVWITRDLLILWQGQFVVRATFAASSIGLNYYLADETGSAALLGALGSAVLLPGLLIQLFAGVWVDRRSARSVMAGSLIMYTIAAAWVALYMRAQPSGVIAGWGIIIFVTFSSIVGAFIKPAENKLVAELASQEHYNRVFSVDEVSAQSAILAGGLLGPLIATIAGPAGLFSFECLGGMLALISLFFIKRGRRATATERLRKRKEGVSVRDDFQIAWKMFRQSPGLVRVQIGVGLIAGVGYFMGMVAVPLLITGPLGQKPSAGSGVALAAAAGGAGGLLLANKSFQGHFAVWLLCGGLCVAGLGSMTLGLVRSYSLVLAMLALGGIIVNYMIIKARLILLHAAPDAMLGRMFACANAIIGTCPVLMSLIGGAAISSKISLVAIFVVCGLITTLVSVWLVSSEAVRDRLSSY